MSAPHDDDDSNCPAVQGEVVLVLAQLQLDCNVVSSAGDILIHFYVIREHFVRNTDLFSQRENLKSLNREENWR